jgi:hypothetical protein
VPDSSDAEPALPDARREVHRAENGGMAGAVAQGQMAARALLGRGQGRAGAFRSRQDCHPRLIETSVEFLLKALRIQPTRVISIHGQPAARTHGQATSWAHGLASAWSHGVLNALTPSLCTHDARRGEQAGGGINQQADRAFHVRLRKGGPYSAFYVRRASTPARALLPLQEQKHSDP